MRAEPPDALPPDALPPAALPPIVVVKLGGETLAEQHDALRGVAAATAGRRVVVVHGGGRRVSEWLTRMDLESTWVEGRRVTDEAALEVATAVLAGLVNTELVASLVRLGVAAVGLTGVDAGLVSGSRIPELGRVAGVGGARTAVLATLLAGGYTPVVAPLALDADGTLCNVNADEVAAGLAGALGVRLVLLSDTDGVLDEAGRPMRRLDPATAEELIATGVIAGGMIPKVRSALAVLAAGGREVLIADGRGARAVEQAITQPLVTLGAGTRIAQAGDDH
jgi:acetylglutamate kinase